MKGTSPKFAKWQYGANSRRLISFSSHRGSTQPLFEPFVRPMSREEQHRRIKEILSTRKPPHPKFLEHMRTLIMANSLTKKQRKKRATLVEELRLAMKKRFGEDVVDVVDISMNNYGVTVRQVPFELAIVDLRNSDGLSFGTTHRKLPKIYSIKDVLKSVRNISPTASLGEFEKVHRFPRPLEPPGIKIITDKYTVSMPSRLHETRRELVKAYCDQYPIFRDLLNLVSIFHYCIKAAALEPLALAYHVLTFFLVRYEVPFYVEPEPSTSGNSMENDVKLGTRFKLAHIDDRGRKARPLDTYLPLKLAKPAEIDMIADGLPIPLGTKGFNVFYAYLKWTLDVDFRAVAFNPGRGLVSRFPTDPGRRIPHKTEAKMLLQGLLDRGDAPKDQQTLDWEYAHIVVQDPFLPLENLSSRVSKDELNRIRNMAEAVLAGLDNGKDLKTAIESILHPSLAPPIMPGFTLESKLNRPPSQISASVTWGSRHVSEEIDEISELGEVPSTDSAPAIRRPSNVIRTPDDLEGSLFG